MAITSAHVRLLWGAVDITVAQGQTPGYVGATQYATLGASAVGAGGIGVRRATLAVRRTAVAPADDDCNMHFDFVNYTGGSPDDTWTSADFTSVESLLTTWFNAVKVSIPAYCELYRIAWHRAGAGVAKPNPAERILDIASPISASGSQLLPPQASSSITFRTGVRRSWGRTYLPLGTVLATNGFLPTTVADSLCTATQSLFTSARSADFLPVVTSLHLASALGIETVEVDSVVDIQRRRRWKHTPYRKLLAA